MTTTKDRTADTARVWKRAAYGGLVVAGVILVFGQTSVTTAVIAGVVAFAAGGYLGGRMSGAVQEAQERAELATQAPAEAAPSAPAPVEQAPAASAAAEPEPVVAQAEAAEEMNLVQPSKALPGEAELAARKGTWRYEGNSATA